ncbi:MAG: hypothetical protein WBG86_10190 [Polyangiales bacterium]
MSTDRKSGFAPRRFPPSRAFVLKFADLGPDIQAANGLIEHIESGRRMRFVGLEGEDGLVALLERLLVELRDGLGDEMDGKSSEEG